MNSPMATRVDPLPDLTSRPFRVLFLRNDRVGDMVVSLAVMRAIAEASPTITVDVLASPSNASLARGVPWIADVIVYDDAWLFRRRGILRQLARRGYDAAVDGAVFVGRANRARRRVLRASGARWRVGLAGRRHGHVYNVPIETGDLPHWIDYLAALARPFGVDPRGRDWRPQLHLSDAERANAVRRWSDAGAAGPRVLVNLSAGERNRRWPDERWRALLGRVRERLPGAMIRVLAMPPDRRSAALLAAAVAGQALTLDLRSTIAAVATADLVVTPDTAISHIASAFERPTLTLLRKGFERLVPYRTPGRNVFGDDARTIHALPEERVLAAFDDLLEDVGRSRGWLR